MHKYLFCIAGLNLATCGGLHATEHQGTYANMPDWGSEINSDQERPHKKGTVKRLREELPKSLPLSSKDSWWEKRQVKNQGLVLFCLFSALAGSLMTGLVLRIFFWPTGLEKGANDDAQEEG